MSNETLMQLKQDWFHRLERVLRRGKDNPDSSLKCLELCEARCCPRVGMRSMPVEKIASPVVVLLPFEMEYLVEKTGASLDVFRHWPIDIALGVSLEVGLLDLGKPCPFLQPNLRCGIHEHNPLDCRTFPLLPTQDYRGQLKWTLGENCPSLHLLNPLFADHMKHLWEEIYPALPQSWWDLYRFADHWLGWPVPLPVEEYAPAD